MRACWCRCLCCGASSSSQCSQLTLLLIGINNAGKTTALNSLKGELHNDTVPTYGFTSVDIATADYNFKVYDLGGGRNIRRIWTIYMSEVHGMIYVVDAADPSSFVESRDALHQLLKAPQLAGKPVLLLANKQDLPDAQPLHAVTAAMGLDQLQAQRNPCKAIACTAKNTEDQRQPDPALWQGLQWLLDTIRPAYAEIQAKIDIEAAESKAHEQKKRKEREEKAKQSRLERLEKEKTEQLQQEQQTLQQQQQLQQPHQPKPSAQLVAEKCEVCKSIDFGLNDRSSKTVSIDADAASLPATMHDAATALCEEGAQLPGAAVCAGSADSNNVAPAVANNVTVRSTPLAASAEADCPVCQLACQISPVSRACLAADSAASSLTGQESNMDSPDKAATVVHESIVKKVEAICLEAEETAAPGKLLGLLLQALPGSAATASLDFSDLHQAAHDLCGPTSRSYSINSDASSLLISEPSQQPRSALRKANSMQQRVQRTGPTANSEDGDRAARHSASRAVCKGSQVVVKVKPGQTNKVKPV